MANNKRRGIGRIGVVIFWLLIGMALRAWQFGWFPLREDEALYSYWARLISSGRDVMLERVAVDKPPFFIYTLARWFDWFGPGDASGRSLNLLISFLTLILVWLLARRLFGPRAGRWSLAMFALSPFAISFAPTVYTDPMLTLWIVLALLAASWRLGLLAGLALGMGFATKQNALLFIPLILLALPLGRWPRWGEERYSRIRNRLKAKKGAGRWILGVGYWALPILLAALGFWFIWYKVWQWDGWRILPAEIPDFWTQSWHSYGGLGLAPLVEWPVRLAAWGEVWRWWGGSPAGTAVVAGLSIAAVVAAWRASADTEENDRGPRTEEGNTRLFGLRSPVFRLFSEQYSADSERSETASALPVFCWILLFAAFAAGYLALHVILGFQAWDRYLLPLTPLSAMLSGYGALWLWEQARGWRSIWRWGGAALIALSFIWGAGRAASAQIPVGGDHGAYSGLVAVADYLRENTPDYHGVAYQRWLGWQWDWYLWDGPPRAYWADPDMLIDDLASDRYGYTRFVVFPGWRLDEKPALDRALSDAGLHLEERLRVTDDETGETKFVVYEIEPHIRPALPTEIGHPK